MNGGFRLASDVNRLYTSRTKGGRGIKSIEDMYESRTIGIMKHLEEASDTNSLIQMARKSENNNVMRLGKEFEKCIQEERDEKRIRKRRIGWISDAECVMKTTKQCITSFVRAQSWPPSYT